MTKRKTPRTLKILGLIILLAILPLLLFNLQKISQFIIQATGIPANIVVDATHTLEEIEPAWQSFAQGGEESTDMIAPVISQVKALTPAYIRIDHMYDHYDVVSRNSAGQLAFNFSRLDAMVKSIQTTGARPFFSLSYMPSVIAENGDITARPRDWNEWALVVQRTIEHYSGRNGFNLSDVYYEVWNEPDLFGNWKYYGEKNYLTLYVFAVRGAQNAQNVQEFKIGGPSTTALYKNWVTALANYVNKNSLRMDFISWHRYSKDPTQYQKDAANVTKWLFQYPTLVGIPRLITEWGFESDMHPGHDGNLAAAHAVATIRQTINGYEQLFAFEVVDGADPEHKAYWGRWGLLTHPTTGTQIKPRYTAFKLLNNLSGTRLLLRDEGTWVTGIASKKDKSLKIILVNYDARAKHVETVPLKIINFENGLYDLTQTRLGFSPTTQLIEVNSNTFTQEIIMPQNSIVLLEFTEREANPFLLEPV